MKNASTLYTSITCPALVLKRGWNKDKAPMIQLCPTLRPSQSKLTIGRRDLNVELLY